MVRLKLLRAARRRLPLYTPPRHLRPGNTTDLRDADIVEGVLVDRTDKLLDAPFLKAIAARYGVKEELVYDVVAAVQWAAFPDHFAPPEPGSPAAAGELARREAAFRAACRRTRVVPAGGTVERVGVAGLKALVARIAPHKETT